jgi:hypothetical protein
MEKSSLISAFIAAIVTVASIHPQAAAQPAARQEMTSPTSKTSAADRAASQSQPTAAADAQSAEQSKGEKPNTTPVIAVPQSAPKDLTQMNCVKPGEEKDELVSGIHDVGDEIVFDSFFLPAGERVDVGVRTPFADHTRYFGYIKRRDGKQLLMFRQDVSARRATEADSLVKSGLLAADQTMVNLNIRDSIAGLWNRADLYLYTCTPISTPLRVSKETVRLSSYRWSLTVCAVILVVCYVLAAFLMRNREHTFLSFVRSLDPVRFTAGPDGRGSLSKFQVLFFSLIVFGLILLNALRTGGLPDLSGTILTLLGISGIGSVIGKGADAQRNTISPENGAWLLRRTWMPARTTTLDTSNASWRDLFSTNGEFDVYRYQSFIFALVVGITLLAAGVTQLSSFTIPETILGIVGLSQVVYIGGKLVVRTNMSDLNAAISDLRDREQKFRDAATTKKGGAVADLQEAVQLAGQNALDAYKDKARDVAALFTAQTALPVSEAALDPAIN